MQYSNWEYGIYRAYPRRRDSNKYCLGKIKEMVRKMIMARIPVLVSKAVPTAEAVEMAKRYHLTLICKAWPDSYEVYCEGKDRVKGTYF